MTKVNPSTNKNTEKLIKIAAVNLILRKGKFTFSLAEVSEESKISRTVVHYYFRSKENLMTIISTDILNDYIKIKYSTLFEESSVKENIKKFIDISIKLSIQYPFLDAYLMLQFATNKSYIEYFDSLTESLEVFFNAIENLIGDINKDYKSPSQFVIDLLTFSTYPYTIKLFNKYKTFNTNEVFQNRHQEVAKFLDIMYHNK